MTAISVIVPMYNNENFLQRCVDSILKQTLQDFELIIIDDASTDRTWEVLNFYYGNSRNVKLFHLTYNVGTSEARNYGIKQATGKYLTWIDHDDYIESTYLETMYINAEKYNTDVSACGALIVLEDNRKYVYSGRNIYLQGNKKILSEMVNFSIDTITWGKIVKRSIVLKNEIKFPVGVMEDVLFWAHVFCCIQSYICVDDLLYCWCINSGSQSMNVENYSKAVDNLLRVVPYCQQVLAKDMPKYYMQARDIQSSLEEFLITTSMYAMHKYMGGDIWDEFSFYLNERLKFLGGVGADIHSQISIYRMNRVREQMM